MKKRVLSVFLVGILAMGLMACSGSGGASVDTQSGEEASGEEEWPEVTIEYWNQNSAAQGEAVTNALIEEFNKTNGKNITVVNKFITNQYQGIATELQTALMTGEYPGVVQCGYSYLNYFADNFADYVTMPDELVEKYAPEDQGLYQSMFDERTLSLATAANGTLMGLPYAASCPILYYNADLFEKAELDPDNPPKTYDELIEQASIITEKTGKKGFYLQSIADTWPNIPMILSTGTSLYEMKDGKAVATFDTPEVVAAWEKLQKPYKDNVTVNINLEEGGSAFVSGEFGMCITTSARIATFQENSNFDLRATAYPVTSEGDERAVCVGGNLVMVVAGEDEAKNRACWEFLKFMYSDPSVSAWVQDTGYLPVTQGVTERDDDLAAHFESNPLAAVALESWENAAVQWPSWPGENGLQVEQIMVDMRDKILTNFEEPGSVIEDAQNQINDLLK